MGLSKKGYKYPNLGSEGIVAIVALTITLLSKSPDPLSTPCRLGFPPHPPPPPKKGDQSGYFEEGLYRIEGT